MPQIAQLSATYASQIFWLLVAFGIVYFFIGRGMVPRVTSTVEARDAQVKSDLAAAEAARAAADQTEEKWRAEENEARATAQQRLVAARAKATTATEKKLAKANEKIDAKVAAAEADIAIASEAALGEIEAVAVEAAKDIVARLSGAKVTDAQAQKAVKAALNG